MTNITIEQVHQAFCIKNKIPYKKSNLVKDLSWNCFAVSTVLAEMLKKENIKARAVYGTWQGICVSKKEKGLFRHGWVLVNEKEILDPTRWVFNGLEPVIFKGSVSKNKEYDEGAKKLRDMIPRPFPLFNANAKRIISFTWTPDCAQAIEMISGQKCSTKQETTIDQAYWMANLSYEVWGHHLNEVYENLIKEHCGAFIPLDFKEKYKGSKLWNLKK